MLEQGIQAPSPAPDLIPAGTSTENLHRDWNYERGHIRVSATGSICGTRHVPDVNPIGYLNYRF
jgi:hypothetical protein